MPDNDDPSESSLMLLSAFRCSVAFFSTTTCASFIGDAAGMILMVSAAVDDVVAVASPSRDDSNWMLDKLDPGPVTGKVTEAGTEADASVEKEAESGVGSEG